MSQQPDSLPVMPRKRWHPPALRVFERKTQALKPNKTIAQETTTAKALWPRLPKPDTKNLAEMVLLGVTFCISIGFVAIGIWLGIQKSAIPAWIVPFFMVTGVILGWQLLIKTKLLEFRSYGALFPNEYQDACVVVRQPEWMKCPLPTVKRFEFRSESLFVELDLRSGKSTSIETSWEYVQNIAIKTINCKPHVGFSLAGYEFTALPAEKHAEAIQLMRQMCSDHGFDLLIDLEPFEQLAEEIVATAYLYQEHAWIYINQC